jgi:O-methyltransferase
VIDATIRAVGRRLPLSLQRAIYRVRVIRRGLQRTLRDYRYSDEDSKFVHILEGINYLRVAGYGGEIPPVYFEFGCHSGRTFSAAVRAARFLRLEGAQFFAFDSFQGLPATNCREDGVFREGTFCTGRAEFMRIVKREAGVELADSNVIRGFYADSLTTELQSRMPSVGMLHIDVDLYSSTVEVLEFVRPLLVVGTVLLFDDWYAFPPGTDKGESKAVREFLERYPGFRLEPWKNYSSFGRSFFVTATESNSSSKGYGV